MQLRVVEPGDAAEIHQLFCVPEVYEYLADGVVPPPAVASDWIEAASADSARSGGGLWALTSEHEPRILGLVRLSDGGQGQLELTYLLHPEIWGSGYATRMAHTAMAHAFDAGLVSIIWAGADEPNVASISVMKKLGMTFRRNVEYPLGAGVEYEMEVSVFDAARFDLLPMV